MEKDNKKNNQKKNSNIRWWVQIFFITLLVSFSLGVLSELLLSSTKSALITILSILALVVFILIAVFCDMIGVAMASADISPFMAMASKKIRGSKETIKLLKNADRTSSFFCDIVGDACGIICGSIGASIVASIVINGQIWQIIVGSVMSAIIAGATVLGKAIGKSIAIKDANKIVFRVGKFLSFFKKNK